jgi:hypothetical protein
LSEVTEAYDDHASNISCPKGVIERIITVFYTTCLLMSQHEGTFTDKTPEQTNQLKQEYAEFNDNYVKSYRKTIEDLVKEWIQAFNAQPVESREQNEETRKQNLMAFLKEKGPSNADKAQIEAYVNALEYDDESLNVYHGGAKRKTRKTRKIKRKTRKSKTRKGKKGMRKTRKGKRKTSKTKSKKHL